MGEIGAAQRAVRAERRRTLRGLLDPNPGAGRLIDRPTVMASPPTVTPGVANGSSVLASATVVPPTHAAFRYLGGHLALTTSYGGYVTYQQDSLTTNSNPSQLRVEFVTDADEFELFVVGLDTAASKFRLWVDGHPATADPVGGWVSSAGAAYLIHVDFGTREPAGRLIQFDATYVKWMGVFRNTAPDSLWAPTKPKGPRVIFVSDSFGEGTGADWAWSSLVHVACERLGIRDGWSSSLGGTGFLNPGIGRVPFGDRLQHDVLDYDPDWVVTMGGLNDNDPGTYDPVDLEAAVLAYCQAIDAAGIPHVVFGPWWPYGHPNANILSARDRVVAGAIGLADLIVDSIVSPTIADLDLGWMTGNGRVGATTGNGNADIYTGSDTTHPTQEGHDFRGGRAAAAIAAWIAGESA